MLRVFKDRDPWSDEHWDELLSAYLDDMLPSSERASLEAQLERNPVLQERLTGLRMAVDALAALPTVEVPRNFILSPSMVGATKGIPRSRKRHTWPVFGWATAAATLLLLLVFAGDVFLVKPTPRSEQTGVAALAPQPVAERSMAVPEPTGMPPAAVEMTVQVEKEAVVASEDLAQEKTESAAGEREVPAAESVAEPPPAAAPLPEEALGGATQAPLAFNAVPTAEEVISAVMAVEAAPIITTTEAEEVEEAHTARLPAPEVSPTPEPTPAPAAVAAQPQTEEHVLADEATAEHKEPSDTVAWLTGLEVGLAGLVVGLALATWVLRRREVRR